MENEQKKFNYGVLWAQIEREATRKFIRAFSRRDFIKAMMVGAGAASLARFAPVALARPAAQTSAASSYSAAFPNGVASGDTTQTSTVLWTRAANPGTVTFETSADSGFGEVIDTQTVEVSDSTLPAKVTVEGLEAGTAYYYRVTDADGGSLSGRFKTPAAVGAAVGLRFGVSGDWRGELRPYPAISNVAARELDFFLEHGDTIYADIPSLDFPGEQAQTVAEYRIKHNEVFSGRYDINFWADIRSTTSILATIDDHEVTNDFAGGAPVSSDARFGGEGEYINQTELYRNGMQVFYEYNPLREEFYEGTGDARVDGRPKLYRYVTYGSDAAVYVIDARSFRDAAVEGTEDILNVEAVSAYAERTFAPDRTFLGRPQLEDLKRDLLDAHSQGITWKFIMLPEPMQHMGWFGGPDRWEGYAPERNEILQFIEDNNIRNVVFVSADVHTTFINDIYIQTEAGGDLIPTHAFEISTGSVAFFPPTGAALVEGAREFGLLSEDRYAEYQAASLADKDATLENLFNRFVLGLQGLDDLGFADDTLINVEQTIGGNVIGHSFGWTEFDIAPETQVLTITTYGVPAYDAETAATQSDTVLALQPEALSQLVVTPQTA